MAAYKFTIAGIDKWVEQSAMPKTVVASRLAIREMSRRVLNDAPLDTGFMIASARVRLNPSEQLAEQTRPPDFNEQSAREDKLSEVYLATGPGQMKRGDSFGLSFVANYTKYVHNGIGQAEQPFIAINLSSWPTICRTAVAAAKAGVRG